MHNQKWWIMIHISWLSACIGTILSRLSVPFIDTKDRTRFRIPFSILVIITRRKKRRKVQWLSKWNAQNRCGRWVPFGMVNWKMEELKITSQATESKRSQLMMCVAIGSHERKRKWLKACNAQKGNNEPWMGTRGKKSYDSYKAH